MLLNGATIVNVYEMPGGEVKIKLSNGHIVWVKQGHIQTNNSCVIIGKETCP